MLPKIEMPRSEVDIEGTKVPVRGLTRGEVAKLQTLVEADEDVTTLEIYVLALGTDTPEDDAKTWYHSVPSGVVDALVREIQKLSGMGAATFQEPAEKPSS